MNIAKAHQWAADADEPQFEAASEMTEASDCIAHCHINRGCAFLTKTDAKLNAKSH